MVFVCVRTNTFERAQIHPVRRHRLKQTVKDGKSLCISDTGIGIDEADMPRIFEKGYTGANGRTDMRASGIGLYLCKNICVKLRAGESIPSVPK